MERHAPSLPWRFEAARVSEFWSCAKIEGTSIRTDDLFKSKAPDAMTVRWRSFNTHMKLHSHTLTYMFGFFLPTSHKGEDGPPWTTLPKQLICTDISSGASRESCRRARLLLYYPQWPSHQGETQACMLIDHGSRSNKLLLQRLEEQSFEPEPQEYFSYLKSRVCLLQHQRFQMKASAGASCESRFHVHF